MELYLYCSYTHSKRGFVLTKLSEDGLIPVSLCNAHDRGIQILEKFFSYDAFRILWQEFPDGGNVPIFPGTGGAIFGIRGLKGKFSDRDGVINFAFLARKEELKRLYELAGGILADPDGFALSLSSCLSVGGACGYQADVERVRELLACIHADKLPEAMAQILDGKNNRVYSIREQLRFAVYIGTWEQAAQHMHPHWIWKSCPKQAMSQEAFAQLLGRDIWH